MGSDLFSPETMAAQMKQLEALPADEVRAGAVVKGGDVGLQASANVDLGKPGGWDLLAEGSWMRRAGGSVAAMFRWRPRRS